MEQKLNEMQTFIIKGAKSKPARLVLAQIDRLKAEIATKQKNGENERTIKIFEKQGLEAIEADLAEASRIEAARINDRIKELDGQYRKARKETYAATMQDLAERQLMYKAMSDDELYAEARPYLLSGGSGKDPMIIDSLLGEMRFRNMPEHKPCRDLVIQSDYRRPFLHNTEGNSLKRSSEFYQKAKPGEFLVDAQTADGRTLTTAANIKSAYGA